MIYPDLLFDHPEMVNCKCGSKPLLSIPCYADETTFVVCSDECGEQTDSYMMGCYEEGISSAINEWNNVVRPA